MSAPDKREAPSQSNFGSGTFIGGDNFGDMVDEKTKALLEKMATQAPELAKLLKRALRDGVISPGAVAAMELAARNINEDVAFSLQYAARNINEEVALDLYEAARKIASHADPLTSAAETLFHDVQASAGRLEDAASQIQNVSFGDDIRRMESVAGRLERANDGGGPVAVPNRTVWRAFVAGIVVGVICVLWGPDIIKDMV